MLLEDLYFCFLRLGWFSSALSLQNTTRQPLSLSHLTTDAQFALKVVLLAWACGSWTQATSLLRPTASNQADISPTAARRLRYLAFWQLGVAYGVAYGVIWSNGRRGGRLWMQRRSVSRTSLSPRVSIIRHPTMTRLEGFLSRKSQAVASWWCSLTPIKGRTGFLLTLLAATLVVITLDEMAHLWVSHALLGPVAVSIRGTPVAKDTAQDDDCVVCLGTSDTSSYSDDITDETIKAHNYTSLPSSSDSLKSQREKSQMSPSLQSFCTIPTHVSHISCMTAWCRHGGRHCPICRRPLTLTIVTDRMLVRERGWLKGTLAVVSARWQWVAFLSRAGVTVGCVAGVMMIVVSQLCWLKWKARCQSVLVEWIARFYARRAIRSPSSSSSSSSPTSHHHRPHRFENPFL
ncbi:hypothetical protein DFS34DRAFT_613656 [Phlyctochytrium arcticum]|nr:hypothetical protein DFS34DRAFT_613656 [Phlyctochytrium arcticum]